MVAMRSCGHQMPSLNSSCPQIDGALDLWGKGNHSRPRINAVSGDVATKSCVH